MAMNWKVAGIDVEPDPVAQVVTPGVIYGVHFMTYENRDQLGVFAVYDDSDVPTELVSAHESLKEAMDDITMRVVQADEHR